MITLFMIFGIVYVVGLIFFYFFSINKKEFKENTVFWTVLMLVTIAVSFLVNL